MRAQGNVVGILSKKQGDQVSGIFRDGPEKMFPVRKPRIIFHSPEFTKIWAKTKIYSYFYDICSIKFDLFRVKFTLKFPVSSIGFRLRIVDFDTMFCFRPEKYFRESGHPEERRVASLKKGRRKASLSCLPDRTQISQTHVHTMACSENAW